MPEYLAPGVYIEETSYRSKSIEGVSTSTAGFVGQALFGPIQGPPVLITSFDEYSRRFGPSTDLLIGGANVVNHLAHAVRAFFENGGKRVYVARVFAERSGGLSASVGHGTAFTAGGATFQFFARYPGRHGMVRVAVTGTRGGNILVGGRLQGARSGDVIELAAAPLDPVATRGVSSTTDITPSNLRYVTVDDTGAVSVVDAGGTAVSPSTLTGSAQRLTLTVTVSGFGKTDVYADLTTHPAGVRYLPRVLRTEDVANGVEPPYDSAARVWCDPGATTVTGAIALAMVESFLSRTETLTGGDDGDPLSATVIDGTGALETATGLQALATIDDIAIVAAPGASAMASDTERQSARDLLLTHCENLKYRCCILSVERDADVPRVRASRARHDSSYGALYWPWIITRNPNGAPGDTLELPPEGFVAGIYARSDINRGVHKAPANEVVRGALKFSRPCDKGTQDVLNPEGINCLRFFEGRGQLVWGARTMSSDPEWKYVNVRRLFIYLEHSIDRATQWAVFEPNNHVLWTKIRMTLESFLVDTWRTGALMGTAAKEAFFVRCDRTTMTQGDLDNGRLVCLIGVAPTKPAEFVIFRIGQWTADASIL